MTIFISPIEIEVDLKDILSIFRIHTLDLPLLRIGVNLIWGGSHLSENLVEHSQRLSLKQKNMECLNGLLQSKVFGIFMGLQRLLNVSLVILTAAKQQMTTT